MHIYFSTERQRRRRRAQAQAIRKLCTKSLLISNLKKGTERLGHLWLDASLDRTGKGPTLVNVCFFPSLHMITL